MLSIPQTPTSECSNMVELLRTRALDHGGHRAFTFLGDGETETDSLTYAELDIKARALASLLQEQRMRGERIVLLHPPGLDFVVAFFGCLYAGAIAVPAVLIEPTGEGSGNAFANRGPGLHVGLD